MAELMVRGVRLHVQRLGSGAAKVIFIHGFVWDNLSSLFFTLAPSVSRSAETLLYDLRGHGKSERPPSGYTLDDMVEDLAELVRLVGWDQTQLHLVGNSYGGLIALAFAVKYPRQVTSLVMIDSEITYPEWAQAMRERASDLGGEERRRLTEAFREYSGRQKRPEDTLLAVRARQLVDETSLVDDFAAAPLYSDAMLGGITCPVLAYYGENSEARRFGEHLARVLPRCDLRIIPGGSHVILWEGATQLRQEIPLWISQHPRGAA